MEPRKVKEGGMPAWLLRGPGFPSHFFFFYRLIPLQNKRNHADRLSTRFPRMSDFLSQGVTSSRCATNMFKL